MSQYKISVLVHDTDFGSMTWLLEQKEQVMKTI